MNNWRAVSYIFLGWGSVFLGYALIAVLNLMSLSPILFDNVTIALSVNAHWFILAALAFVVGVVGYYAGRDGCVSQPVEYVEEYLEESVPFFSRENWEWSIAIGALTTLGVLGLHYALGTTSNNVMALLSSVVAGSLIGIAAYYGFFRR